MKCEVTVLTDVRTGADPYKLNDLRDLSAEALAETLRQGQVNIVVESALCEWGSPLEDVLRKLESSVMTWREDGVAKTILIQFTESSTDSQEEDSEDVTRLNAQ